MISEATSHQFRSEIKSNTCTTRIGNVELLFSYHTLVAVKTPHVTYILSKGNKFRTRTTAKHITQWTNSQYMTSAPIEKSDTELTELANLALIHQYQAVK